jgi:hypothetical protein
MTTQEQHATDQADATTTTGSTGPGAAGNARKHGLTASKCFSEAEKVMIAARRAELERDLHPEGREQHDAVLTIAMTSVRLERCQAEEQACRLRRAERAEFYWNADMWAEVMKQVQSLPKRPELIASKLRQSLRGCMWMLKEWRDLAGRVGAGPGGASPRPLDETGRRRAGDLLGLSAESRVAPSQLDLPCGAGSDAELARFQQALIAGQITELEALTNEDRVALDESIRIDTMNGVNLTVDDATRLIRRYESEARRVQERAYQHLKALQDAAAARKKEAEKAASREAMKWYDSVRRKMGDPSLSRHDAAVGQPVPQAHAAPQAATAPEAPAVVTESVQVSPVEMHSKGLAAVEEALQDATAPVAPAVPPVTGERHLTRRARKVLAARAANVAKAAHRTPR